MGVTRSSTDTIQLDQVFHPSLIRVQSRRMLESAKKGGTHFEVHPEKCDEVAALVVDVIRKNYPTLEIPFHSRFGHFRAGKLDRSKILDGKLSDQSCAEKLRSKLDLVIVSVLLDAGAGNTWTYLDQRHSEMLGKKTSYGRSEGLAVASFEMFMTGAFSKDKANPYRADSDSLIALTEDQLKVGFQVTAENPLIGVKERTALLQALGRAFPGGRPSDVLKEVIESVAKGEQKVSISAVEVLRLVQDRLGSIWPGRMSIAGRNIGDVWLYQSEAFDAISFPSHLDSSLKNHVPFHKLSQWLTYSIIEALMDGAVQVPGLNELTGLAEYRNGGLMLDSGLLSLRNPSDLSATHEQNSKLVIEWRSLTLALLDELAAPIRRILSMNEDSLPMVKILEGGTWWAGRRLASEKRPKDMSPPLHIHTDGTLF